jgi:hypothetical protein
LFRPVSVTGWLAFSVEILFYSQVFVIIDRHQGERQLMDGNQVELYIQAAGEMHHG